MCYQQYQQSIMMRGFINSSICAKREREQNNPFPLFTPSMKIGDVDALHTMRFRGEWMMDDG